MPNNLPTVWIKRWQGTESGHSVIRFGGNWVWAQLFDHDFAEDRPLANKSYTLRGRLLRHSVSGTTDEEGALYADRLPGDDYEVECEGATESVPMHYDHERGSIVEPWALRMRAVEGQSNDDDGSGSGTGEEGAGEDGSGTDDGGDH